VKYSSRRPSRVSLARKSTRVEIVDGIGRYVDWPEIDLQRLRSHRSGPGHRLTFLRMPGVNRQGQAHIVSTAIRLPRSCKAGREVEATPWFRTWFSIDPQPASISPTINVSIVFICAFLVDCGRIIRHPAIKNDSRGDSVNQGPLASSIG
jgi:hypothetical protein